MNSKRIRLNTDNRVQALRAFTVSYFIVALFIIGFIYNEISHIFIPLMGILFASILYYLIRKSLFHYIATGYIQDDYIVIKVLSEKSYILDKKYIKAIKHIPCLFFTITQIHFKFDGIKHRVALVSGNIYSKKIKELLSTVIKQKKASHKPGSVNLGV